MVGKDNQLGCSALTLGQCLLLSVSISLAVFFCVGERGLLFSDSFRVSVLFRVLSCSILLLSPFRSPSQLVSSLSFPPVVPVPSLATRSPSFSLESA